jgi:hypothetical protein
MSVYPPPNYTEPISIFNTINWETDTDGLTRAEADLRYLRFPVAQGLETLQEIVVNGVATFNNTILANQPLNIVENTNPLQKSIITQNNTTLDVLNDNNSGIVAISTKTGVGVQTTPLSISSANLTITTTNPPTCSAVQPISTDSSTKMPTTAWVQGAITTAVPNLLPLNNTWTGTQLWSNVTLGSLKSNALQPLANDNTTNVPTTAWVQTAISASPGKTYTIQYTSSQTIQLPVNCVGISVCAIGQGGNSGNASNSVTVGLWNAGGSGSAGTTITSNGILPFKEGQFMDIIITPFLSELYATSVGATVCRANCGGLGGNASFGAGGLAGVSNNSWIVNNAMTSWNVQIGPSGPAGGTNLAFQSATFPATGGIPICVNWSPSVIHGCGQNWNGFTTTNSYQGPAIAILGGAIWITYYLK